MQIASREWADSGLARAAVAAHGPHEIQIWRVPVLGDRKALCDLAACLSPDEHERANRFSVKPARDQFITGRAALRQMLGACLNVEPAALTFDYQPRGKPYLDERRWQTEVRFNVSHSGSWVVIALTHAREVGVDIEAIERVADWQLLAGRIFSPGELSGLRALPELQQREAFYHGWTRKEAYLKATGEGLIDALVEIEVTLVPGHEPELLAVPAGAEELGRWEMRAIPLPAGYAGAVVFEAGERRDFCCKSARYGSGSAHERTPSGRSR